MATISHPGKKESSMNKKAETQAVESDEKVLAIATMMAIAEEAFEEQVATLGRTREILVFKRDITIQRIKSGRHGRCDCGTVIDELSLKTLEIFCDKCLIKQAEQALFLHGILSNLNDDLAQESSLATKDLQDNSQKKVSNHDADCSPSDINVKLSITIPGLKKRLHATEEALRRVPFGKYGVCEECWENIDPARLSLIPAARHCVDCKKELEKLSKVNGKIKQLVL